MRISDFDVLIVPRLGGAGEGDWPSRWSAKLSTARVVAPSDVSAARARGMDRRDRRRRRARPNGRFCSSATGSAQPPSRAPPSRSGAADVRGAFLVSPTDLAGLARVAGEGWSLPRAPLPWPTVVVASRNAADGAYDAVAALAAEWGAELIDAGHAGGLDAERPRALARGPDAPGGVHQETGVTECAEGAIKRVR